MPTVGRLLGDIGTIEWCRRTNGILDGGERARFLAAMLLATARGTPRLLAAKAGWHGSGPDPSTLTPPDTPFVREVVEACADLDQMVIEHGYRSYLFARALGIVDGIECDEEALFVGALLHDYAFESMDSLTDECFTLAGANVAADLLAASPFPEPLRRDVLDGITLHLNPAVSPQQGGLQHLLHDGIASTSSACAAGSLIATGAGASRSAARATLSTPAASPCCERMGVASTAAGRARSSAPVSARPCGSASGAPTRVPPRASR